LNNIEIKFLTKMYKDRVMNNSKKFLALALLVSFVSAINADATPKGGRAVVDAMRVSTEAEYFKAKQESIKKDLEPEARAIESEGLAFQKTVAAFESKASTMSEAKKQEEGRKLAEVQQKIQAKQQALQTKAQTIMASAETELRSMIAKICEKLGFSEVDHKQGKLYVHKSLDKTDLVIAELNKTTKATATPKIA
jgi:Skp family chaperone for outer membrane proteins